MGELGEVKLTIEGIKDVTEYVPRNFKVLTKADKRGASYLVPMKLWKAQRHYLENRGHRDIILKGRQMGLSSGVMAGNAHIVFTTPYTRMAIITHNQDTSEFLMQVIHRFYNNLPKEIKPKADWASGARLRLPVMDCYIYIDSAESKAIGIGHGLNIAHMSEVSRWPEQKANDLFAGISQTVPAGGYITLESTPKGRGGLFHRLYSAAKKGDLEYKTFFYPWWWDENYKIAVDGHIEWTREERQLMNNFGLQPEQIAFRRLKIKELGDLFYQEYPENDVDCWLSNDVSVFDGIAVRRYLQQIQPGRVEGTCTIWKDVIGGEKYVIGADTAAGTEKGDYSVGAVLRVRTNEYVARIRGKLPPDIFAQELMKMGQRYNMAQIGVERIMHGHSVISTLLNSGYPSIYYHNDYDRIMDGEIALSNPGWVTSSKTKPLMINTLNTALRSGDVSLWSENFLMEASGMVWDGEKAKASWGGYDDEVIAVAIALQLREVAPILPNRGKTVSSYASF